MAGRTKLFFCGFDGFGEVCRDGEKTVGRWTLVAEDPKGWEALWSTVVVTDALEGFSRGDVKQVCEGESHRVVLTADGQLWKRGVGRPATTWSRVSRFWSESTVVKITCGHHIYIALDSAGCVYSIPSLISMPVKVNDVCCGKEHVLLLTADHQVYSFGGGSRGQLGHGTLDSQPDPQPIAFFGGLHVHLIACGGWHSAAVTQPGGDLYMWGWNESGQLALPTTKTVQPLPSAVEWPTDDAAVTQIACGSRHTLMALSNKTVWSCGWNRYGQLGTGDHDNRESPVLVMESNIIGLKCGPWSSTILVTSNT